MISNKLFEKGFNAENTLFGHSTCPEPLNHSDDLEDITTLFEKRWGELFEFGAEGGVPFNALDDWPEFS